MKQKYITIDSNVIECKLLLFSLLIILVLIVLFNFDGTKIESFIVQLIRLQGLKLLELTNNNRQF